MTSTTTVAGIMTRDIFAVGPETDLGTTARLFAERHISGAPVIDDQHRPVGVVALTDLVDPLRERSEEMGASTYYHLSEGTTAVHSGEGAVTPQGVVADVMSRFVLSIDSATSLRHAAERMVSEDVHRLFVVEHGRLVGVVSTMDVIRGFLGPGEA